MFANTEAALREAIATIESLRPKRFDTLKHGVIFDARLNGLRAMLSPNLYYVAASIDGEAHSGDLFVRAYSSDEARAWWRGYFDVDNDTGIEKIDEIPAAATVGPIRWEDVPNVYMSESKE